MSRSSASAKVLAAQGEGGAIVSDEEVEVEEEDEEREEGEGGEPRAHVVGLRPEAGA